MARSVRERVHLHRQISTRGRGLVRVEAELPRALVEALRPPGETTRGMLVRALAALRRQMAARPTPDIPRLDPPRRRAARIQALPETPEPPRPTSPAPTTLEARNRALEAQIRAMDAAGLTMRQIANRLNKAGVPAGTETGRWDRDTVLAWLVPNAWYGESRVSRADP